MTASIQSLYKAHVKNLRAVDTALDRILRELNGSLARRDEKTSDALTKTAMLLLGAWAENRLRKLTFEPQGFSPAERSRIAEATSQLDSWKEALEIGFRKRHSIPRAKLEGALPITGRTHYKILLEILEKDLKPIIEVRNKLAHGQWARTLTNANDDFSTDMMARIAAENAHTIKCKKRLLSYMAQLIHDLVAGNAAFTRDFDAHYKNLELAKQDMQGRSFEDWKVSMEEKLKRGKAKRSQQS